jgi:hypothetical protein
MRRKLLVGNALTALFLALAPTAIASNTWYVNGVNGNDNNNCMTPQTACETIGHAISLASSGDSIMVAAATYEENLTVAFSLTIIGSNDITTIIDGGGVSTVLTISNVSARVTLSKLTIQNGSASQGGGIYNAGTLTLNDSTVSKNIAGARGGSGYGAGVYNLGTLTINRSTIAVNTARGHPNHSVGGGIWDGGLTTINDSTIRGNYANCGAGVYSGGREMIINNSTLYRNNGQAGAGGAVCNDGELLISNSTLVDNEAGVGGAIYSTGYATLQNSIVSNSQSGGNCWGRTNSSGYNLSSDNTCKFNGPGDLNNTEPKLGTLGNYGGPTQTIKEALDSPTVDAGNPSGCTDFNGHLLTTDQRGFPRPGAHKQDKRCDMGAYEVQTD